MDYAKVKIYTDGSHYIGIPQSQRPTRKRPKRACRGETMLQANGIESNDKTENEKSAKPATVKEEVERLYKENSNSLVKKTIRKIVAELAPRFEDEETATAFVERNIERMERNKMERNKRFNRKIRLQQWNFFCTFTYDSKKHTPESFRKSLINCLRHLSMRRGWKYIGVWELSPKNKRLHFHCVAYIPEGQMIGEMIIVQDYDTKHQRMQRTYQNSHFLEQYGRNDFKEIIPRELQSISAYLKKYLEKTGEKIVYSRGLATYFVSDIFEKDVICPYGVDDRKLLLVDNFTCMNEGEIIGTVSPAVIQKLPKAN